MDNYNGRYEQCQEVIIDATNHEACQLTAQKIIYLCKAWVHSVKYDQRKSARKGDVLQRSIMIYQTAYAGDIIAFRESLRCICYQYDLFPNVEIRIIDRGTIPEDSRRNILN